jgi:hypothetical protein
LGEEGTKEKLDFWAGEVRFRRTPTRGFQTTFSHIMISDEQRRHYATAAEFLVSRRERGDGSRDESYPLNRGDILLLVMLLEQEMAVSAPSADAKRLAAIREKLGDLVPDAPEMTKGEAQKFR